MPSRKPRFQLYADECFPVPSVTYLKSLGYSIVHAYDIGFVGKSDQVHLKEAKRQGRVLITIDRDFLYYQQVRLNNHPGVIVISSGSATPPNINILCRKLLRNISQHFIKDSLVRASVDKLVKIKNGMELFEKRL